MKVSDERAARIAEQNSGAFWGSSAAAAVISDLLADRQEANERIKALKSRLGQTERDLSAWLDGRDWKDAAIKAVVFKIRRLLEGQEEK